MKVVKAKCAKTGKKIVLQVSDTGTEVLGYFKCNDATYDAYQSEVRITGATTKSTCPDCGSNRAFSCEHKYNRVRCGATTSIDKNCLQCKHLAPDYGRARNSGTVQIRAGEVAALELSALKIGVGWDSRLDIDSSVIMANGTSSAYNLVYYASKIGPYNSVIHRGDNVTGIDDDVAGTEDDENIDINLDAVPQNYDRLVFVINIFSGADRFGNVKGLYLNIYDQGTGDKLIEYQVERNFSDSRSLIIGEARRVGSGWEFKAIGEGSTIPSVHTLAEYCATHRF